jgi:two-component system CheB/CheR fusion protein
MAATRATFTHLVVIGASAGGVEALSALVASLPTPFPAPIVIAQHLDPTRPSHMNEVLGRHSPLPVETARDKQMLEPGHIYIAPPNQQISVVDTRIALLPTTTERFRPSIDTLFESAAAAYEERAIAVVVSGTSSDGAAGARVVKATGGTVIIQDPATALYPEMPLALAPTTVDIVAPLERIGPLLAEIISGAETLAHPKERESVEHFLEELRARMGLDFTNYKTPTILRRLQRRILATNSGTLEGYSEYLATHPQEYQQLISSFLIKVTEFFRDSELFDYLRATIVPDLIAHARQSGQDIRIWSAGCATGEEAYSLAIVFTEALEALGEPLKVRIFATDLDADAIAFARRGIYPLAALEGISDEFIDRYFTRRDDHCQVKKHVRSLLVFGQHDLSQRAAFPQMDLVVCRNVLIYFTGELQQRSLQLFAYALRDGGYLVLGKAESTGQLSEYFAPLNKLLKVYRRQGERVLMPPSRVPVPRIRPAPRAPLTAPPFRAMEALPIEKEPQRLRAFGEDTLLHLPLGLVLVNRHYDIQAINPTARRMLGIHGPALGEDLVHLAQNLPARQLQSTLDAAFHTGQPTTIEAVRVEGLGSDEQVYLHLLCSPQPPEPPRTPVQTVLLVIAEVTELAQERQLLSEQLHAAEAETARVRREAAVEREQLQEAATAELERLRREQATELASREVSTTAELERLRREQATELNRQELAYTAELERLRREQATELARREQAATAELERVRREAAREVASRKEAMEKELEHLRKEASATSIRQETANKRLVEANRQLVGSNEELTQANEALRTENEDLVVRNEEAQAATEEVETLNEELQATSEELETLNEELQSTIEELHSTNDDLQTRNLELQDLARTSQAERAQLAAILLSIDHALLVVNQEGKPVLTNPVLEQLFGSAGAAFVAQDAQGQPLPKAATPQQRAAKGEVFRLEFTALGADGQRRWFAARSQPIKGQGETILGGAIIIEPLAGPPTESSAEHAP